MQQLSNHAETEAHPGSQDKAYIYHQVRTWNRKRRCRLMYHHCIHVIGRSGVRVHEEIMLLMLQKSQC